MQPLKLERQGGPALERGGPTLQTAAALKSPATPETPAALESQAARVESDLLRSFKEKAGREDARYLDATDSEFWVAICFQTRAQKEEFLQKAGLESLGDKYLDGEAVARALGVMLESPVPLARSFKLDRTFFDLTFEGGER